MLQEERDTCPVCGNDELVIQGPAIVPGYVRVKCWGGSCDYNVFSMRLDFPSLHEHRDTCPYCKRSDIRFHKYSFVKGYKMMKCRSLICGQFFTMKETK